jgi:hypothetical protein
VCALTADPFRYSGKVVSIRAYVIVSYHGTFLADRKCSTTIQLVLPEGSVQQPPIKLVSDAAYRGFEAALIDVKPGTLQPKRRLEATFEGRFEYLVEIKEGKHVRVSKGDGPAGYADWQFVLQRVSSVKRK